MYKYSIDPPDTIGLQTDQNYHYCPYLYQHFLQQTQIKLEFDLGDWCGTLPKPPKSPLTMPQDEKELMKRIVNAIKVALGEGGEDSEDIVPKGSRSDVGSPSGMDGEDRRNRISEKRKKIRDMKRRMNEQDQDLSVLNPEQTKKEFRELESNLFKLDLTIAEKKYSCVTQAQTSDRPTSSEPTSIILGLYGVIPRWKKQTTVNFAVYAGGWPSSNHANFAAYRLNEAAVTWNSLNLGVTFKWVGTLEDACFVLGYGGDGGDTLARAFFPNSEDLNNMYVYQRAFQAGNINYLYNFFLHELGHVLGLRHEFAPETGEGAGPLVVWGMRNPASVMSYTFPPQLQPSDRIDTKSFYAHTDSHIQNVPIQDHYPNN